MAKKKNILKEIQNRYSPRAFLKKPVEKEKLDALLEAARVAPSGFNNQPWRYIIVKKDAQTREALEKSLMPGNGWAKDAPLLIVCYTNKKFQKSAHDIQYHVYDSALSVMSLALEAEHQGLKTHQMGGFFANRVKKTLSIPTEYDVIVVIAVGYEKEKQNLKQKIGSKIANMIVKPRQRKAIEEIASFEKFKE